MGITDEEIAEAVQCAYSVGAGVMWAMADRAKKDAEEHFRWWDRNNVLRAVRDAGAQAGNHSPTGQGSSSPVGKTEADVGGAPGS